MDSSSRWTGPSSSKDRRGWAISRAAKAVAKTRSARRCARLAAPVGCHSSSSARLGGGAGEAPSARGDGLRGAAVEAGVPLVEDLEQGGGLGEIDPGEARVVAADVPAVVDEVRELHGLGTGRRARRVTPVDRLAHRPVAVARLADVGELGNQAANRRAEGAL
jgi:hypothetical protein